VEDNVNVYRLILGGFLVIAECHVARADNWGHAMRFALIPSSANGLKLFSSDRSAILGDGDIESDTPALLEQFLTTNRIPAGTEMHLNSRGGDVDAGLKMGRIIRAHRLNTWIGGYDQFAHRSFKQMYESTGHDRYPAYCISSCTLAFLGGIERRTDASGSIYAVHQVRLECVNPNLDSQPEVSSCLTVRSAQTQIQSIIGRIVSYIAEMGVNPQLIAEMAKAEPETVNSLSTDQMLQYKILTRF
jgi:hypothetical protein